MTDNNPTKSKPVFQLYSHDFHHPWVKGSAQRRKTNRTGVWLVQGFCLGPMSLEGPAGLEDQGSLCDQGCPGYTGR